MLNTQHSHQSSDHPELDHARLESDEMTKQEQSTKKSRLACAAVLSACLMGAGCASGQMQVQGSESEKDDMHVINGSEPIAVKAEQPDEVIPEEKPEEPEPKMVQKVEEKDVEPEKTDDKEENVLELVDKVLRKKLKKRGLLHEADHSNRSYEDENNYFRNPSLAIKVLKSLERLDSELFNECFDYIARNAHAPYFVWFYDDHPNRRYAKDLLMRIAEINNDLFRHGTFQLRRVLQLPLHKEWVEIYLTRSQDEAPEMFLKYNSNAEMLHIPELEEEGFYENLLNDAVESLDENNLAFLTHRVSLDNLITKHPRYEELQEKALRQYAEKDPEGFFTHDDLKKTLGVNSYFNGILKELTIILVKKKPFYGYYYIDKYIEEPWAEEVLMTTVDNDDFAKASWLNEHIGKYKHIPFVQKAIIKILLKDPRGLLDYFDKAKEILGDKADEIKRAYDLLPEAVEESDFPLTPDTFDLTLRAINEKAKRDTEYKKDKGQPLVSIPIDDFRKVFYSNSFQDFISKQLGELTYMNVFSLAQDVYYRISEGEYDMNDDTIRQAVSEIYAEWEYVSERELFGPNTQLILFTHEDEKFNNDEVLEKVFFRSGGTKKNILANAKGMKIEDGKNIEKEKILDAIRNSKGVTTVLFSGHGSPENWSFSNNQSDRLDHYLGRRAKSINYQELGDALIESGNIENINLIGATCSGYNYLVNLFEYLEQRGVHERPYVGISAASDGRHGYSGGENVESLLLDALYRVSQDGNPIAIKHFFKAEGLIWQKEDPSIFINPSIFNVPPKCACDGGSWSKRDERRLKKILTAHIYEGYHEHPLPFESAIKEIIDHYNLDDDDIMPFYTGRKISNNPFDAIGFSILPFRFFIAPITIKKLSGGTLLSRFVNRCPEMLKEVEPSIIFKTPGMFYDFESINKRMRNAYWPWTEKVVTEAARKDPEGFVKYYDRIKGVLPKDRAEELLEECKLVAEKTD